MSFFQRLFGGSKGEDPNVSSEQAIQRLSSVEDVLIKKQEHLESQIEIEKSNAVRLSKQGNKRGALLALKKKKKYEKTLIQVDGTLTTIESQRESLQNAQSNIEVFRVMRGAAEALKKSNGGIDADTVHELKDDLDEQLTIGNYLFSFHFIYLFIYLFS
jgi:charged multivesicular body protein 4